MKDPRQPDRRQVLGSLAAGTAALTGLGRGAAAAGAPADPACLDPAAGPNAAHFARAVVTAHDHRRLRFYEDLLAGKTVMVNFMSIATEAETGVTANLARVQPYLGDRLGREIFMYSLTVDPERDSPAALAEFARRHGARDGWLFLTGAPATLRYLRERFFVDRVAHHLGHDAGPDCSTGLVRYGHEGTGVWGSAPARARPDWLARRLAWVLPAPPRSGGFRRRGPLPREG